MCVYEIQFDIIFSMITFHNTGLMYNIMISNNKYIYCKILYNGYLIIMYTLIYYADSIYNSMKYTIVHTIVFEGKVII